MIFLSDVVFGILGPTFSLFVVSLGGSLAIVGVLGGIVNLTRLASAIPTGIASDLWGRKSSLVLGLALLTVSLGAYSLISDPLLLASVRVIEGLGTAAVLTVGIAALSDAVPLPERGGAIGIYMTAMGFGYALGGAIGGSVVQALGFALAYQVVALVPVVALVLLMWLFLPGPARPVAVVPLRADAAGMLRLGFDRYLLPANLGNFLISMTFSATVVAFVPLYAASVGVSAAVFGSIFGVRSLLSTLVRIPVGMVARGRTHTLMISSLAIVMTAMAVVPSTAGPVPLLMLLCAEGIAYGCFITVGQIHISSFDSQRRGAVLGIYSTFASLGSTLGSIVLGILAQTTGLANVFYATSLAIALGILGIGWLGAGPWTIPGRGRR
jgi:MFS family permease